MIAEGERVTLRGRARLLGEALVAPLTGELCVAHLSRARVFTALDHVGDHITDLEFFECAPFVLDAPEGSVLVTERPSLVSLEPVPLPFVEPARILDFLRPRNLAAYGRSTFFEHVLVRDGERVTMSGVVTRELAAGSESSFRELDAWPVLIRAGPFIVVNRGHKRPTASKVRHAIVAHDEISRGARRAWRRSMMRAFILGSTLLLAAPSVARADGWWETACNSDGHEGSGGCTNPDNPSGCTCETGHGGSHAATVGSGLALFGIVAWRIGRRRRR